MYRPNYCCVLHPGKQQISPSPYEVNYHEWVSIEMPPVTRDLLASCFKLTQAKFKQANKTPHWLAGVLGSADFNPHYTKSRQITSQLWDLKILLTHTKCRWNIFSGGRHLTTCNNLNVSSLWVSIIWKSTEQKNKGAVLFACTGATYSQSSLLVHLK